MTLLQINISSLHSNLQHDRISTTQIWNAIIIITIINSCTTLLLRRSVDIGYSDIVIILSLGMSPYIIYWIYSQLPLYRSRRDLYYLFDITEFREKWSYIIGLKVLGENIHFDISGYFVISEFDIEGVTVVIIWTKNLHMPQRYHYIQYIPYF